MNDNIEIGTKYLPIGTVVMLKGGKKRAMITGFCSIPKEDTNSMYDYSGCTYPEGFVSSDVVCLFNHDQIEKVYFKGFVDEEELNFKDKLNELLKKMEEKDSFNKNNVSPIRSFESRSKSTTDISKTVSIPATFQTPSMSDE